MSTTIEQPYSKAMEALARDLAKLDATNAQAVIDDARKKAYTLWLREQIRIGDESGPSLDGPTVMAELLAEAEADVEAARRRGEL